MTSRSPSPSGRHEGPIGPVIDRFDFAGIDRRRHREANCPARTSQAEADAGLKGRRGCGGAHPGPDGTGGPISPAKFKSRSHRKC
jgi:hypothetical protein